MNDEKEEKNNNKSENINLSPLKKEEKNNIGVDIEEREKIHSLSW